MLVKCIQDALPVDVSIVEISYWCLDALRDHAMASKVRSVSFHRIPFRRISNRRCIASRG